MNGLFEKEMVITLKFMQNTRIERNISSIRQKFMLITLELNVPNPKN